MTARPDLVTLDSGRQVDVVEELTTSAPLGVRFWDWALDRPVRDGLLVRARPRAGGPVTTARPSSSGVYGFLTLPTTRGAEHGPVDEFTVHPEEYVLGVWDTFGRYVPMALTVAAPVAGVQPAPGTLPEVDGESPALPGFPLFAAATRTVPPGYPALRTDLCDQDLPNPRVADDFGPAAHALVEVALAGETWFGLSDARGRALLIMPAPTMTALTEMGDSSWEVEIRVHYERLVAEEFPGVPDFVDIAAQPDARAKYAGALALSTTAALTYGEELVVTTPQRSDLLVKAPAQP